jgi:hypothetical protein
VNVAGDAYIRAVGGAGEAVERLLEELWRGESLGERKGVVSEFGLGVDEDGFVDEVLLEERAVEVRAAFEEGAEDVAFGESGEDGREAETSVVVGDLVDFYAE